MYEFSGGLDLVAFIEEAQRQDLLVILRVGPYICAERDMVMLLPFIVLTDQPRLGLTNIYWYRRTVELKSFERSIFQSILLNNST